MRSFPAAGTGSPSRGARTPASTRRAGRERRRRRRAAGQRAPRRSTRRCRRTWPSSAREEAPEGFHARFSAARALVSLRVLNAARPFAARGAARALVAAAARPRRPRGGAALLPGEHDFRAFTPTETQHQVFVRDVACGGVGAARRPSRTSRSRRTRSCGTWCGRSSGRCSSATPARVRASCSRGGRGRARRARRRRPWGLYLERVDYRRAAEALRRGAATIAACAIPVVLFDLDGTLVDSGPIILASMRHAAADRARARDPRRRS